MSNRMLLLALVILPFGALTALALGDVGYFGLFEPGLRSWAGGQVLADLVILAMLACIWIVTDARRTGINPWPFVLLTLAAGSFGPLFYLVARERTPAAVRTAATTTA
jgi:hypothetical protein